MRKPLEIKGWVKNVLTELSLKYGLYGGFILHLPRFLDITIYIPILGLQSGKFSHFFPVFLL